MAEICDQRVAKLRANRPVHWRKDPLILARLMEVEQRYLNHQTNVSIAAALGVAESTIRNDIKRLQELWLEQTKREQAEHRANVIAKLQHAQRLALAVAQFDEAAERAVLYGADVDGNPVEVIRDLKGTAQFRGQKAAAIATYRQAVMDEAKVLGVVVDKVAPTDGDGNALTLAALVQMARIEHGG